MGSHTKCMSETAPVSARKRKVAEIMKIGVVTCLLTLDRRRMKLE